jgi:two-component system, LuxR family, sensor kinase FixL
MLSTDPQGRGANTPWLLRRSRAIASAVEVWPLPWRLGLAAFTVLAAFLLRLAFFGSQREDAFITFFPAVALAFGESGLLGGAMAALFSVAIVELWINPFNEPVAAPFLFLIGSALVVYMVWLLRVSLADRMSRDFQRKGHARLMAIVNAALEGVIAIDKQGVIQYVNAAACEMFGYEASELIGSNVAMLMPEPDSAQHGGYIANYLRTGEKKIMGRRRTVMGRRKNGEIFPKELTVTETSLGDEDQLFVGMMRDLSAFQREKTQADELRNELFHANRLNEMCEVVETLAHDFAQPLTAIANFLAAARRLPGAAEFRAIDNLIAKAEQHTQRASDILVRLRGFIEKHSPERAPENLHCVIECALDLTCLGDGHRDERIELREIDDKIVVDIDLVLIEQVLVNLLRNAVEATKDASTPKIVVETSLDKPGYVRVSVSDNGSGVDPEAAPKLFKPFASTKKRGMGLGLSLAKSIVERHGGEIGYRPADPHGAAFFFTLPIFVREDDDRRMGETSRVD